MSAPAPAARLSTVPPPPSGSVSHMVSRLLIPLLCTGAFALACGPRSHPDASVSSAATEVRIAEHTAAQKAAQRARRARHDGQLVPTLAVAADDQSIRFALAVANAGSKTLEMHFPNGQTHDIVVLDSLGREVWRWAEGRMFTQAHRTRPIASGDTLRIEESWDVASRHGRFTAVAKLKSSNYPVEQRVTFDLR